MHGFLGFAGVLLGSMVLSGCEGTMMPVPEATGTALMFPFTPSRTAFKISDACRAGGMKTERATTDAVVCSGDAFKSTAFSNPGAVGVFVMRFELAAGPGGGTEVRGAAYSRAPSGAEKGVRDAWLSVEIERVMLMAGASPKRIIGF